VPVLCKEARGKDGEDYDASGPWNDYRAEKLCWYEEPKFRRLYPEYKDLTEDDHCQSVLTEPRGRGFCLLMLGRCLQPSRDFGRLEEGA